MLQARRLILVCGYSGCGKDHLAKNGTQGYSILRRDPSLHLSLENCKVYKFGFPEIQAGGSLFVTQNLMREIARESRVPIITDWRFPEQYYLLREHYQIRTVRVHRLLDQNGERIALPHKDEVHEHALDDFVTDFLVIPRENYYRHLDSVYWRFPQYDNHIPQTKRN